MTLALIDSHPCPKVVLGTAKVSRTLEDSSHALIESGQLLAIIAIVALGCVT